MRKTLTIAVVVPVLLVAASPAVAAPAPRGFIGISPQSAPNDADYRLMAAAGIRNLRLPLPWSLVEPYSPYLVQPNWDPVDFSVGLAAKHGLRVMPFFGGSPPWVSAKPQLEPSAGRGQLRSWAAFLRRVVRRYGAGGAFWSEHPELPYLPIRLWEIWNEENIVTFGRADPERFARLLRVSGRAIHGVDRRAKVILGGLFGRPLQVPPNVHSADFLHRVYRARNVKRYFDGVALHPYVADALAMRNRIRSLRRVMRIHHDARTPLYLTELGWGSASYESRWERGLFGQARELDQAFRMLTRNRRRWRIGGVWWFSWADVSSGCQFCDSAGLLTEDREAKPSWYRFNAWTRGDPGIVPRAAGF